MALPKWWARFRIPVRLRGMATGNVDIGNGGRNLAYVFKNNVV